MRNFEGIQVFLNLGTPGILIVLAICICWNGCMAVAKNLKRIVPNCGKGLNGMLTLTLISFTQVIAFLLVLPLGAKASF
jgi:hypothetical protein